MDLTIEIPALRADVHGLGVRLADHEEREAVTLHAIQTDVGALRTILDGDEGEPGLLARQEADDKAKADAALAIKVLKFVGAPLLAVLLTVGGAAGNALWTGYQERGETVATNERQIEILKDRIDRVGDQITQNQAELLRALGR